VAASGGGGIKTQWLTLLLSRTCKEGPIKQARELGAESISDVQEHPHKQPMETNPDFLFRSSKVSRLFAAT
jgi:hypothetical protein